MKDIKKVGIKPKLEFSCKLCGCEWNDNDYEVRQMSNVIFSMGPTNKLPTSDCPTCGMPSNNYTKLESENKSYENRIYKLQKKYRSFV